MTTKPPEALNPLERMKQAGAMLANCAFNLAQSDRLNERERRSLAESRIAWDEATSALNASDGWVCVPVERWKDFHMAFKGAFDTPVAWKRISGEYAEDARHRENEINEAMIAASQEKANEQ